MKGDEFAEINTLGIAWLANIGGIMTPIGTPGNAVTIGLIAAATGQTIGFVAWTLIGTFTGILRWSRVSSSSASSCGRRCPSS